MKTSNNKTTLRERRSFRNYIVEPKFQHRYLRFLIGSSLVPVIFTITVITYFLNENYALLVDLASLDESAQALLRKEYQLLVVSITASFVVFIFAIAILGLIYSHRIAGVVHKLRLSLRDLADGKTDRISFRDYDEFQDLADDFNRILPKKKPKVRRRKKAS